MGFLDSALGSLMNSGTSGGTAPNAVAQMLENLVQQHGGIGGLITQLAQGGLAQHTTSWIGTGANEPMCFT